MISIAMATFNGEKFVEQQLMSILSQTVKADEIIICDDKSTDNTAAIVQDFISRNKMDNVTFISNESNLGYIRNFYKAISLTHGDYIFLADQDDEWHNDKIEKSIQFMKKTNASAVCTKSHFIDEHSNPIPAHTYIVSTFLSNMTVPFAPISFQNLILENIAQGCTYCFTKEVKNHYLALNSTNLIHDYQILFISSLVGCAYALNESTIDYRLHQNNAAGIQESDSDMHIVWKKPKKKPPMVLFLEDLERRWTIPYLWFYKLLYCLRVPYFLSVIKRRKISKKTIINTAEIP